MTKKIKLQLLPGGTDITINSHMKKDYNPSVM
jgi:hypothetical protein